MPGARTLRCAAHRSVRSTGGLAPPARACSGIAQRPLIDPTDWPGCSQGICRYASRACSGSASPTRSAAGKNSLLGQATWQAGHLQLANVGRGAAERAGRVPLHSRPHQLRTGYLAVLDRKGGKQVCSPNAVRRQHRSFSRASGIWLAGRCETPPQHAPTARTSKG